MKNLKNPEQENIKFKGKLWPPDSYFKQLENLYKMLNKPVVLYHYTRIKIKYLK